MKKFLKTSIEYAKSIAITGALTETSRYVEEEITRAIDGRHPQTIVELGGGHGNITRIILEKMHPDSRLYTFEIMEEFIPILKGIQDKRLLVVNDSAEHILKYVHPESVDCVVSSLPITILPKDLENAILTQAHYALKPKGSFHQVLYSIQRNKFKKLYPHLQLKPTLNFPLAFVHHCNK